MSLEIPKLSSKSGEPTWMFRYLWIAWNLFKLQNHEQICHLNCLLDVEIRVSHASDLFIGLQDALDLHIGEVVERVQMLLDESLDFQIGRNKLPFLLQMMIWSWKNAATVSFYQMDQITSTDLTGLLSSSKELFFRISSIQRASLRVYAVGGCISK